MLYVFLIIPILATVSSMIMYRQNGKKEFLKFDLVQFFYAFIVAPMVFVWAKTFLYFLLKNDISNNLSQFEFFLFDTTFSTIFMFIYAFIVIHSLTKSFSLKRLKDPLYDIFKHSKYFHAWLSHLIIFGGALLLISFMSILNAIFPVYIEISDYMFYGIALSGIVFGIAIFFGIWVADPKKEIVNFIRIMKILYALFFTLHVVAYFSLTVPFSKDHSIFWCSFFIFLSLVSISVFSYKTKRVNNLFFRILGKYKHRGYGL